MTLPYELHELIIDELRYSFPELKACNLVRRAWLPRCRLHLFRVIRIGPRRVRGIEKEQTQDSFNKFQASFAHTFQLSEITSCVRILYTGCSWQVTRIAYCSSITERKNGDKSFAFLHTASISAAPTSTHPVEISHYVKRPSEHSRRP
ncbi:hypothetical protein BT96DRAFT_924780 [Gymnopus androsaceus JB14]|uniref:F-box domain-containing protein n=1 Tax=Gymnopus androsaceus JB14 TaxID=1447944 RepID=A0A6A4H2K4_9AGAR|nr:hypothetical protein BT96DRAFT_924780 [Gymnopus androsaceus JB14]